MASDDGKVGGGDGGGVDGGRGGAGGEEVDTELLDEIHGLGVVHGHRRWEGWRRRWWRGQRRERGAGREELDNKLLDEIQDLGVVHGHRRWDPSLSFSGKERHRTGFSLLIDAYISAFRSRYDGQQLPPISSTRWCTPPWQTIAAVAAPPTGSAGIERKNGSWRFSWSEQRLGNTDLATPPTMLWPYMFGAGGGGRRWWPRPEATMVATTVEKQGTGSLSVLSYEQLS